MASHTELRIELKDAREKLAHAITAEKADGILIAQLTDAVNDLGSKYDATLALALTDRIESEAKARDLGGNAAPGSERGQTQAETKTWASALETGVKSAVAAPRNEFTIDFDAKSWLEGKTVMSTGAGLAPQSIREPGTEEIGRERRYVTSIIPFVPTTQAAYVFMAQTTRTNAAAEAAESVQGTLVSAAESAFVYTEITETLRKITHMLPVTREQIEDVPGLLAELQAEMREGVLEKLSSQVIVGTGTAPEIEGFLDAGRTSVGSQAKGADDILTAIKKGIQVNESTGYADVDAIMLNPAQWTAIQTLKTADGVFIFGNPAQATANRLWGYQVIESNHVTAGTALLGGFRRYARIPIRGGVTVEMSNENASNFEQDVWTIKASVRATLAVRREAAFTKVTGL
jgi:HK97 family phage major capsid protein